MMNMTEFVAAGGADDAAAYWRYQQRFLAEGAIVEPLYMAEEEMLEEMERENLEDMTARDVFESGWDI